MTGLFLLGLLGALADPIQTVGRREPVASIPARPTRSAGEPIGNGTEPPFIHGRVLDELGMPLAGWSVGVQTTYFTIVPVGERVHSSTDDAGRFAFHEAMGPGLALVLRSQTDGTVAVRENFRLDGQELVLRINPEERPTGFLEGLLVGPDGAKLTEPLLRVSSALTYRRTDAELIGERFRVGPLPPGEYVLCAKAEGLPELCVRVPVESSAVRDLGTLTLASPGWVEVHLAYPGIALGPEDVVNTILLRDGQQWSGTVRNGPAAEKAPTGMCALGASLVEPLPPRGRSRPIAPGRYLLRTRQWCGVAPDVQVEVSPGRTTDVSLTLQAATSRTIVVRVLKDDPALRMSLRVTSKDGSCCWEQENGYRGKVDSFVFDVQGLLPDTYRVEAHSPSSGRLEAEFVVLDLGPSQDVILEF